MSVISRRQRDLLLNDVNRMINNNIHSAFTNHAKIAECISNGDLKLYIDSPKKEVVIKYGNKNIRFTIAEQMINEIAGIVFNDKSIIKGISDSCLTSSSIIALSTKGASNLKSNIDNKADKNHNHDDKYADINHNHDSKYADKNHTHDGYQPKGNYAAANHTHSNYADKNHTHWGMPEDTDDFEEEIKNIVNGPKWWRVTKTVGKVLGVASDVVQYGTIAALQAEINALYTAMSANGLMDAAQTASTLGTSMMGYAKTFRNVGDSVQQLGKRFESIAEPCKKISTALNKGADKLGKYSKIVDDFFDINGGYDMTEAVKAFNKGQNISKLKLPKATSFTKSGYSRIA